LKEFLTWISLQQHNLPVVADDGNIFTNHRVLTLWAQHIVWDQISTGWQVSLWDQMDSLPYPFCHRGMEHNTVRSHQQVGE
jgi:hypothetical protein